MAKPLTPTPMLDELESGPWPSFVTGLKRLANDNDMMVDLLGQLETSYKTRKGYWKGGTVGVVGYGGGVIPRFTELHDDNKKPLFPEAAEFHTLRIMPTPGFHYSSDLLRKFSDIWEKYGSGLIAFHGQSGDIMFQGCTTENVQPAFDAINEMGHYGEYDYLVFNDDFDVALLELEALFRARRLRCEAQQRRYSSQLKELLEPPG